MAYTTQLPQRFWGKVDKSGECWLWTSATNKGYGLFMLDGKAQWAHRLTYEDANGPIPEGREIDHICRNPACVRPSHLRAVVHIENMRYQTGPRRNNTSGYRGVTRARNKWKAQLKHEGKCLNLGHFDTPEEASRVYEETRERLHPILTQVL